MIAWRQHLYSFVTTALANYPVPENNPSTSVSYLGPHEAAW